MTEQEKFTIVPIIQTVITGFKKVPVYDFDELSEDVRQRLINNYSRDILAQDFFEFDIDFYVDEIKAMIWDKYNLPISHIYYDLSYSQGSGATFKTDDITDMELKVFIKKTFPDFVKSFRAPSILFPYFCENVTISFSTGRCTSYNNLYIEGYFDPDEYPYIDNYLSEKLYQLEKLLEDFSGDLSDKITDKLYAAYEYSYSDENIIEQLRCNRYFKDGTEA